MLVLISTSTMAKWTEAGRNDVSGLTLYTDYSKINKLGNHIMVPSLVDFKRPQNIGGVQFLSLKIRNEVDCNNKRIRPLEILEFSENMGDGKIVYSNDDPGEWIPVVVVSIDERLWKIACSNTNI